MKVIIYSKDPNKGQLQGVIWHLPFLMLTLLAIWTPHFSHESAGRCKTTMLNCCIYGNWWEHFLIACLGLLEVSYTPWLLLSCYPPINLSLLTVIFIQRAAGLELGYHVSTAAEVKLWLAAGVWPVG